MAVTSKNEPLVSTPISERTGKGKRIYEALKDGAKTIDEIAIRTKLQSSWIESYIADHKDDFVAKKKNHKTTYHLQSKKS